MKRLFLTLMAVAMCVMASASVSMSKIRNYARFLSDRMAYELDFSSMQYEDCYEINYDFLVSINPLLDDMAWGYQDAIERYYDLLDYRNDDLRFIMTSRQYMAFLKSEYFYRPIYTSRGSWAFRIHTIYSNVDFFYFDAPRIYKTYAGSHSRLHFHDGYYISRYSTYEHHTPISHWRDHKEHDIYRRNDFGANIKVRGGGKYDINNYNNRNQTNRTRDSRYKDNRDNVHSPEINKRNDPDAKSHTSDKGSSQNSAVRGDNGARPRGDSSSATNGSSSQSNNRSGSTEVRGNSRRDASSGSSSDSGRRAR